MVSSAFSSCRWWTLLQLFTIATDAQNPPFSSTSTILFLLAPDTLQTSLLDLLWLLVSASGAALSYVLSFLFYPATQNESIWFKPWSVPLASGETLWTKLFLSLLLKGTGNNVMYIRAISLPQDVLEGQDRAQSPLLYWSSDTTPSVIHLAWLVSHSPALFQSAPSSHLQGISPGD